MVLLVHQKSRHRLKRERGRESSLDHFPQYILQAVELVSRKRREPRNTHRRWSAPFWWRAQWGQSLRNLSDESSIAWRSCRALGAFTRLLAFSNLCDRARCAVQVQERKGKEGPELRVRGFLCNNYDSGWCRAFLLSVCLTSRSSWRTCGLAQLESSNLSTGEAYDQPCI